MIEMLYMTTATSLALIALAHACKQERKAYRLQVEHDKLVMQLPVRVGGSSDVDKSEEWMPFGEL